MNHPHPIPVTGAAGRYGAIGPAVVKPLLERGFKVRAMVRREDGRSAYLQGLGAEVVVGDLLDLHAGPSRRRAPGRHPRERRAGRKADNGG